MKKIILTYGLIAGAVVSAMLLIQMALFNAGVLPHENGMLVGYTTMVIAFSMIFFGIKNYRDSQPDRSISFAKGFRIGILITVVASLCYAVTWEIYYSFRGEEFTAFYIGCRVDDMKKDGIAPAEIEEKKAELIHDFESYKILPIRFGMTLMEIFPVGLVVTLITAGILKKRVVMSV